MNYRTYNHTLILLAIFCLAEIHYNSAQAQVARHTSYQEIIDNDEKIRYIYWIDQNDRSVKRGNLNTFSVENIASISGTPSGLAFDHTESKLYWATHEGNITQSNMDGSATNHILEGLCGIGSVTDITIDIEAGEIYWANHSDCQLMISRTSISNPEQGDLVHGPFPPSDIALNSDGDTIYWTSGAILKSSVNNPKFEIIIDSLEYAPGIVLDNHDAKIYWTEYPGLIRRADLTGDNIEDVLTGLDNPIKVAIDAEARKLYWTERDVGKIRRANLDGTEVEDVFVNLSDPTELVLVYNDELSTTDTPQNDLPSIHKLIHNYPNPFDTSTKITLELSQPEHVVLSVYDTTGRKISEITSDRYAAGAHHVSWSAHNVSSGLYILRLEAGLTLDHATLILMR
jgi:hypothetical protein